MRLRLDCLTLTQTQTKFFKKSNPKTNPSIKIIIKVSLNFILDRAHQPKLHPYFSLIKFK